MATPRPIIFPFKGLNKTAGYDSLPDGFTHDALNVRPHDPIENRLRGGRRPGLSKWVSAGFSASAPVDFIRRTAVAQSVSTEAGEVQIAILSGGPFASSSGGTIVDQDFSEVKDTDDLAGSGTFTQAVTSHRPAVYDSTGVYIAGIWDGLNYEIRKYDPTLTSLLWSVSTNSAVVLAIDSGRDRLFVADESDDELKILTASTGVVEKTVSFTNSVYDVLVREDGYYYVSAQAPTGITGANADEDILLFDSDDSLSAQFEATVTGRKSLDFATGGDVIIYAAQGTTGWGNSTGIGDATNKNVFILSADLSTVTNTFLLHQDGGSTVTPYPLVKWSNGGFTLAGPRISSHTVRRYNSAGTQQWEFDTGTHAFADDGVWALSRTLDGEILVTGVLTNDYDGAGSNANTFVLNESTGSLINAYDYTSGTAVHAYFPIATKVTSTVAEKALVSAGGTVQVVTLSTGAAAIATNGNKALTDTPYSVQGVQLYDHFYFVDGTNFKRLDLSDDTMETVTATDGTAPSGCRLAARYRGRLVLSGKVSDAHNYFMSKQGDPLNWEYSPSTTTARDAVAGNLSEAGLIGDVINALLPLSDDAMLFGCDSSIWVMSGDPAAGGAVDLVADNIGMAFGAAWVQDPAGTVYFLGVDGVYTYRIGSVPQSITEGRMDSVFQGIDLATSRVELGWDKLRKQLWVIVRSTTSTTVNVYIWDKRTDSWWEDSYHQSIGPTTVVGFDSANADDIAFLVGCRDGYVRKVDDSASDDDGRTITNRVQFPVVIGPDPSQSMILAEMTALLAEDSGNVDLKVFTGRTAERAVDSTSPRFKRVLTAGRNTSVNRKVEAPALIYELGQTGGSSRWALERLSGRVIPAGRARKVK